MRLIDANALLRKKYEIFEMGDPEELFSQDYTHNVVSVEDVKNAPTVDAVPVVRCKDCVWYRTSRNPEMAGLFFCYRLKDKNGERVGYNFSDCGFCSYGERINDD